MFLIPLLLGLLAICMPAMADSTWVAPGNISGNWTTAGSPYIIQGNDTVATGATLDIGPGVRVYFSEAHRIVINGLLRAQGTQADSIYFTTDTLANPGRWHGLHFSSADTACVLSYCVVEYGRAVGTGDDRYGGGIEIRASRPAISHSRIRYCYAQIDGGGIYSLNVSAPVFTDCEIYGNSVTFGYGGGMMGRQSNAVFTNCTIRNNSTPIGGGGLCFTYTSHPVFTNCVIRNNSAGLGGGIYGVQAGTVFTLNGCTLLQNSASQSGGGLAMTHASANLSRCLLSGNSAANGGAIMDSTGIQLENCLLVSNTATANGGAIFSTNSAATNVRHCTFYANGAAQGGQVYGSYSAAALSNSIFAGAPQGGGVEIALNLEVSIHNCDFSGNSGGDVLGDVPPQVGVVDTVNLNGDPCDQLQNIFLDPQFVNAAGGDFHLSNGSACISAALGGVSFADYEGGPRPNPDDTQPDIGAYESAIGGVLYACGPLSGEIGPGDVIVPCDITVESGDTLVMAPGTRFLFTGGFSFTVFGTLRAVGTEADSISFIGSGSTGWRGLRFINTHDSTLLSYVIVEGAQGQGYSTPEGGGGVYITNSDMRVEHSTIRGNHASYRGGGVGCYTNARPTFSECVIEGNSAEGPFFAFGGGVYASHSAPIFESCIIDSNSATHRGGGVYADSSSFVLTYCTVRNNVSADGGGLYADAAAPGLGNCTFEGNYASGLGGGMFLHSHAVINDTRIQFNQAESGGGAYCDFYDPVMNHCVLTGNSAVSEGGGFYARTSAPVLRRCTLVANSAPTGGQVFLFSATALINSSILANTSSDALYLQASNTAQVRYCDFSANPNGNFGFFNDDPSQGPAGLGLLNRVNVNGDSADSHYNIFLNPQFINGPGGDFHIQNGSPCVQAGDPELPHDPDGTLADIGAFYAGPTPLPPLPFDLLSPANGDTISTPQATFCWQSAIDPDVGDTVIYRLRFISPDTTVLWNVGDDTCITISSGILPFEDSVNVVWWVEAHSMFPDTITNSISTRTFFWAQPGQGVNEPSAGLPRTFALHANYPNPFNASTEIGFDLPISSQVKLEIFDVLGRVVATLMDETRPAGTYRVSFDASQAGSGIYFARMEAGEFVAMQKMVLVK